MSNAPLITINGHVLNSRFRISEFKRPFPQARVVTETVPGMDGEIVVEQTIGPRYVSFRLWAFSMDHARLYEDMADIATLLLESKELVLSISDEGGRIRNVVLDGELDFDEYEERGSMPITLKQPDPYCDLHESYTALVPSGSLVDIVTYGHVTAFTITADEAYSDVSSNVWGLRFDEGDFLHVELPNSESSHSIEIDCDERIVLVDGVASMATLDSDWPDLQVGVHTVRMDQGTGDASITWRKRCL